MRAEVASSGAGIPAFFTATGVGTQVADGGLPWRYHSDGSVAKASPAKQTQVFQTHSGEQEFVLASRAVGVKGLWIVLRHILPNVLPVLMVVMAAGAVPVARWAQGPRRTAVLAAGLVLAAASSAVITLPLLPASSTRHIAGLNAQQGEQLGWPDMVETVAGVWQQIPAQQRDRSVLLVFNYGETGAIARYGPEHGLPAPYSGHMSFADWGPPPDSADGPVLLVVPAPNRWVTPNFKDCRTVASIDNGYGLDNELWEHVVKLCSGPVRPWSQLWPSLRHY